jgi:hypothetical protein
MHGHTACVGGGEKDTQSTSKQQIVESDTVHPEGTKTAVDGDILAR